jgi:putative ATP-dependent endonuclease of OLD family
LDELGISLINIRSTGFQNVAILFNDVRIRKKCSIITDLDVSVIDTTPAASDLEEIQKFKLKCKNSQSAGLARKVILDKFIEGNPWIKVFMPTIPLRLTLLNPGMQTKQLEP